MPTARYFITIMRMGDTKFLQSGWGYYKAMNKNIGYFFLVL
jgi:hypothetical protein